MRKSKTAEGILVTRALLKQEIDKVQEENLAVLYNIIKVFGMPVGTIVADAGEMTDTASASAELNWEEFIQETYGCLKDDPIERGSQGEFELREAME
ncbi:MAG: hypothetical protein D3906_05665 [Candidatus Electrothrix sp. AUS1_2]|nr:hypothetical protein [Candidatus Electrothrix sp. AUS1_2]